MVHGPLYDAQLTSFRLPSSCCLSELDKDYGHFWTVVVDDIDPALAFHLHSTAHHQQDTKWLWLFVGDETMGGNWVHLHCNIWYCSVCSSFGPSPWIYWRHAHLEGTIVFIPPRERVGQGNQGRTSNRPTFLSVRKHDSSLWQYPKPSDCSTGSLP